MAKNWYRERQIFEVRQAHPRMILVKLPPPPGLLCIFQTYVYSGSLLPTACANFIVTSMPSKALDKVLFETEAYWDIDVEAHHLSVTKPIRIFVEGDFQYTSFTP